MEIKVERRETNENTSEARACNSGSSCGGGGGGGGGHSGGSNMCGVAPSSKGPGASVEDLLSPLM